MTSFFHYQVLEQSLYVVLAQALLILNQPDSERITAREKQVRNLIPTKYFSCIEVGVV